MIKQKVFDQAVVNKAVCQACGSTKMRFGRGKVICSNCDAVVVDSGGKRGKFGNVRQTYEGYSYDSRFEANVAYELDLRQRAGEIKAWDRQFKIPIYVGDRLICNHYVDFRIHHNDGSFELYEAKGVETEVYKIKRKLLEATYLLEHPDTTYTVVYQKKRPGRK